MYLLLDIIIMNGILIRYGGGGDAAARRLRSSVKIGWYFSMDVLGVWTA